MLPLASRNEVLALAEARRVRRPAPRQRRTRIRDGNGAGQEQRGVEANTAPIVIGSASGREFDTSKYMDLPTADEIRTCHREYLDAMSNENVSQVACAVCAQECWKRTSKLYSITDIPNGNALVPTEVNAAYVLHNGMLLAEEGILSNTGVGERQCVVCDTCNQSLTNGRIPKLALVNKMWIGKVPEVLRKLTVPEQMLIALYYPKVYVYKLFPRDGGVRDPERLQRAMGGNVTVYPLNVNDIMSMLEGHLLPRPPMLLASLIAICFVGTGRLPKRWLKGTFRVRRAAPIR